MLVISIDPVIFQSGAITVRWFGLITAAAIAFGLWLGARSVRRAGLGADRVLSASVWAIPAGIVGARLLHVIDRIDYYLPRLSQIMSFSEGGLSLYGALVFGGLAGYVALARSGPGAGRYLDALAAPLLIAIALGRIANLISGDASGGPTDLAWGLAYLHPRAAVLSPDVAVHPYPAYEVIGIIGLLIFLRHLAPPVRPGCGRFVLAIGAYGVLRLGLISAVGAAWWYLRVRPSPVLQVTREGAAR